MFSLQLSKRTKDLVLTLPNGGEWEGGTLMWGKPRRTGREKSSRAAWMDVEGGGRLPIWNSIVLVVVCGYNRRSVLLMGIPRESS